MINPIIISLVFLSVGFSQKEYDINNINYRYDGYELDFPIREWVRTKVFLKRRFDMNDFKKGLLVGIVIMSSIFLFIASTSPKMESNDRREIVEYKLEKWDKYFFVRNVNRLIEKGWQPFGASISTCKGYTQTLVKYKED